MSTANLEVVERGKPLYVGVSEQPAYWCFLDRSSGCTVGNRYPTREAAEARLAELRADEVAALAVPCALCKRPMSEHVRYQCPEVV